MSNAEIYKEVLFTPLRMVGAALSYMWNSIAPDIGNELARQTSKGATELAAGLFNGSNAFVMYGDRYPPAQRDESFEPIKPKEVDQEQSLSPKNDVHKEEAKQEQTFSPKDAPKEEAKQELQQTQQQRRGYRQ